MSNAPSICAEHPSIATAHRICHVRTYGRTNELKNFSPAAEIFRYVTCTRAYARRGVVAVTRDRFRALVAREFCADHLSAGFVCDIGKRAAAAAVAVLHEHRLQLVAVDELEPADDRADR